MLIVSVKKTMKLSRVTNESNISPNVLKDFVALMMLHESHLCT